MQVKKFEAPTMKEALEMVKVQLGPDAIILSAKENRGGFGLLAKGSVEVTAAISELQLKKRVMAESKLPDNERDSFRNRSARLQKSFIEKTSARSNQMRASQFQERKLSRVVDGMETVDEGSRRSEARVSERRGGASASRFDSSRGATSVRYIDIDDEGPSDRQVAAAKAMGRRVTDLLDGMGDNRDFSESKKSVEARKISGADIADKAKERVRNLAKSAFQAGESMIYDRAATVKARKAPVANHDPSTPKSQKQNLFSVRQSAPVAAAPSAINHSVEPVVSEDVTALKKEIQNLQDIIKNMKPGSNTQISLHPGADFGISFDLSPVFEKLTSQGVMPQFILPITDQIKNSMDPLQLKKRPLVEAWVAKYFLDHIEVVPKPSDGRIHLFVGPSGQGKTSSLVKMASHLIIKEKRHVAILSADTGQVGAVDQLRIFSQILNVPFGVIRSRDDWDVLLSHLTQYDAILVDFPGSPLKNLEEIDLFKSLLPPSQVVRQTHYVLSATARDQDAIEIARRYQMANFQDVIFTNLDESTSHGIIVNFQQTFKTPLHSFGTGRLIPEDFEWATRERVVDVLFKITKLRHGER